MFKKIFRIIAKVFWTVLSPTFTMVRESYPKVTRIFSLMMTITMIVMKKKKKYIYIYIYIFFFFFGYRLNFALPKSLILLCGFRYIFFVCRVFICFLLLLLFFRIATIFFLFQNIFIYKIICSSCIYSTRNISSYQSILASQSTNCLYYQAIFVLGCVSYSELTYKRKHVLYEYPSWAIGVGWMLALVSVVLIPIFMVQRICVTPGTFSEVPLCFEYYLTDSCIYKLYTLNE